MFCALKVFFNYLKRKIIYILSSRDDRLGLPKPWEQINPYELRFTLDTVYYFSQVGRFDIDSDSVSNNDRDVL